MEQEQNIKCQSQRDIGIDLLKTIAIFGVIVIHMCSDGYSNPMLSFNWTMTVFWGSITRASVPIFLMCSGTLLLDYNKKKSIKDVYFKNILRIVLAMLVWSMAYKIYHLIVLRSLNMPSLFQAIKEVLLFKQEFHMYYLHIILLVYVFLPITRVFVKNASKNEMIYALIIWFILGIVYPTIKYYWPFNLLSGIPVQWLMNMTYASIGYGILGYYLTKYPLLQRWNVTLFVVGLCFVFLMTIYTSAKSGVLSERFLEGMSFGVSLLAIGLFGLCYNCKNRICGKTAKFFTRISNGSFCIFLVHVFVIYLFGHLGISVNDFTPVIMIPLLSALNLLISYVCYYVISKIPFVNRWLI